MRKTIICVLLLASCASDKEILKASELNIGQFKGQKPPESKDAANLSVSVHYYDSARRFGYRLNENKSWWDSRVPLSAAAYLLNHEEGHLKIAIIYAKKMKRDILKLNPHKKAYITKRDSLIKYYVQTIPTIPLLYDKETEHSLNQEQQRKWDSVLLKEMKKLYKIKLDTIIIN